MEKDIDLDKAPLIDCTRTSDDPDYIKAAETLEKALDLKGKPKIIRRNTLTILINFARLNNYKQNQYIRLGRSDGFFRELSQNTIGLTNSFTTLIDACIDAGLIDQQLGFIDREWSSRLTRIRPTNKFIKDYIEQFNLCDASTERKLNLILISRHNEVRTTPPSNKAWRPQRKFIESFNAFIEAQTISIDPPKDDSIPSLFLDNTALYRVFNRNSPKKGGRFYGAWWQTINSNMRQHITINGDSTIEMDFKAQHIHLIYGLQGVEYVNKDDDPYDLEAIPRNTVKDAVLTAVNARDKTKAWKACQTKIRKRFNPDIESIKNAEHMEPIQTQRGFDNLVESIVKKHPPLRDYLCSDKGIELMYLDSEICAHIMATLMAQKVPVLPIHDSFIVQENHRDKLMSAAHQAYDEIIPKGRAPLVEVEKTK